MSKSNYHHGDLAETLINATVSLLSTKGAAALSLREVSRLAGVSHSAPAHHFKDKAGLLTAVAIEGHKLLAQTLRDNSGGVDQNAATRYRSAGESYIRFAIAQPAYFEIMFRPELINREDPFYQASSGQARDILENAIKDMLNEDDASSDLIEPMLISSWSQVHGFAVLWLAGNFGDQNDMTLLDQLLKDLLYNPNLS